MAQRNLHAVLSVGWRPRQSAPIDTLSDDQQQLLGFNHASAADAMEKMRALLGLRQIGAPALRRDRVGRLSARGVRTCYRSCAIFRK